MDMKAIKSGNYCDGGGGLRKWFKSSLWSLIRGVEVHPLEPAGVARAVPVEGTARSALGKQFQIENDSASCEAE